MSGRNIAASVHQHRLNIAKAQDRPFAEVLQYYTMERFLYRFSITSHSDSFVLKGALLFRVWDVSDRRATRDIDLLGHTDNSPDNLAVIFREVCETVVPEDGLVFDSRSVAALPIKKDAEYQGVRIRFPGYLERARIQMQIDVGFGDTVHPQAQIEVLLLSMETRGHLPRSSMACNSVPKDDYAANRFLTSSWRPKNQITLEGSRRSRELASEAP